MSGSAGPSEGGHDRLREQVLRGGGYMAARQIAGMGLSLVGVVLLTRRIGPEAYGVYAAAISVFVYAQVIAQWGIGLSLIRRREEVGVREYDLATTLLLTLGVVTGVLVATTLPLLSRWVRLPGFPGVTLAMMVVLPGVVVTTVPMSALERRLEFGRIAVIEMVSQATYFGVALPLAYCGASVWAAVIGWTCGQVVRGVWSYRAAGYAPRWRWDSGDARAQLSSGFSFCASNWVVQLRGLITPLVVAPLTDARTVGCVALATRIVDTLCFPRDLSSRIVVAALSRIQAEPARLRRVIETGTRAQVLAVAPLLLGFAMTGPVLMPRLFGSRWELVGALFPFVALGSLADSLLQMQVSALQVLHRNRDVLLMRAAKLVLLAAASAILIRHSGGIGRGWAEIAALPAGTLGYASARRALGPLEYGDAALWSGVTGLALLAGTLGPWFLLPLLLVTAWPGTWRRVRAVFVATPSSTHA